MGEGRPEEPRLFTLVLGYGAGALVGPDTIKAAPGGVNSAAPLLAFELGGTILLGVISAVAFATILAVVAGLTITAATSFAHDIYANVIKKGEVKPDGEVRVARITVVAIGILAIVGGIFANGQNVAFLVALAFAVAASANLPTIIYSLFWKRFNTAGALWSMYGGLISCIALIAVSPVVSGKVDPATGASLSMIRDTMGAPRRTVVLHGCSYVDELGYRAELEAHERDGTYPLRYVPTISRPNDPRNAEWSGRTGRVEAVVESVCHDLGLRADRTVVYICGNPEMILNVERVLMDRGFPEFHVKKELYWPNGKQVAPPG